MIQKKILKMLGQSLVLLGISMATNAQTVTSQITGTYPNFSWAEWDQTQSQNLSINIDPAPGILGCWTGLLLNEYPAYPSTGSWIATWNMAVPTAGQYKLEMEYAMDRSSLRPGDIFVDGVLQAPNALGAATGGWCTTNLLWSPLGVVSLQAGTNSIRWQRVGGELAPHFHGIRLAKMEPPTLSKALSPASAAFNSGIATSRLTLTLANPGNTTGGFTGALITTADFVDTLPAGMTVASTPNLASTCTGTVTAIGGASTITLPSGSTLPSTTGCTIEVDVQIDTSTSQVLTNTLPAGALVTDGGASVAPASASFTVLPPPQISVSKTTLQTAVIPGGTASFTITVSNNSASNATGVLVTDIPPATLTTVSWTCTATGGAVCPNANGSTNIQETVDVPAGGALIYTLNTTVSSNPPASVVNVVSVSPGDGVCAGGAAAPCTASAAIPPIGMVGVSKVLNSATPLMPGSVANYTVTVSNTGSSPATAIAVADALPAGATSGTWTCTGSCGAASGSLPLADTIASLASGDNTVYSIAMTLASSGLPTSIVNTVSVTPSGSQLCTGAATPPCTSSAAGETGSLPTPPSPAPIPTLGQWALMLLSIALAGLAIAGLRRTRMG